MSITAFFQSMTKALFATVMVCLAASSVEAQTHGRDKMDSVLRLRARQLVGRSRVIVQFKGDPDVRVFGRGFAGRRLNQRTQVADVDNRTLEDVASDPRVERVMIDRPTFATMERTGAAIGATIARQEFSVSGRGVGVAIIDSGISSLPDDLNRSRTGSFQRRVVHFKDFTRDESPNLWFNDIPTDEYGHGTHVAGVVAGSGYDSAGKRTGVAPNARLVGLKVLDGYGEGHVSDVIAAIDYAVSIRSYYNIRVINLSVASGVFESYWLDPLTQAARRAANAGIVVVAAAGNLGRDANRNALSGGITSPGNAPWVLTVGATSHMGTVSRSDDVIGDFSSHGPTWIDFAAKPDIVAPGVGIESTTSPFSRLYGELSSYLLRGTIPVGYKPYLSLSGTSMSAPVVAGTVALMLEANPTLTPNAVKAILQYTAQSLPDQSVLVQGGGLVNAEGAVRLSRFFANPQDGIGTMSDTIGGESIAWARHIIWGNYHITGGVPLPGSNAWAKDLTWGALKTQAGQPVVWGAQSDENIVWSTTVDQNIVWSTGADENIVWSTAGADQNIVWSTGADENIVWSTANDENIVWSTATARNVVWGNDCGGRNCLKVLWGATRNDVVYGTTNGDENIVWSTMLDDQNIVWSTSTDENIVWSTTTDQNIVWSTTTDQNIVWSTSDDQNIVWSTANDENIVWSTATDENIVWSTTGDENIVWSTGTVKQVLWPSVQ
jgi:serine protease AprX